MIKLHVGLRTASVGSPIEIDNVG